MFRFDLDLSELENGINKLDAKMYNAIKQIAKTETDNLTPYMQSNRPWIDRSNRAKEGLNAKLIDDPTGFTIELSHGVEYGIFLELANEGRFSIIEPTIRQRAPILMSAFSGFLNNI